MSLKTRIPDPDVLTSLAVEEVASQLLQAIGPQMLRGNNMVHRDEISRYASEYPQQRQNDAEVVMHEAWRWLELNLFILPTPGINGIHGWFALGRRGRKALEHPEQFTAYSQAAAFPRELLHPLIAEQVWAALARGDFDVAVLYAFRTVEEAVRSAGGFGNGDYGVDLMRDAFKTNTGPLTNKHDVKGEQEALAHLFAGALSARTKIRARIGR